MPPQPTSSALTPFGAEADEPDHDNATLDVILRSANGARGPTPT
jgi:hypothetical protein